MAIEGRDLYGVAFFTTLLKNKTEKYSRIIMYMGHWFHKRVCAQINGSYKNNANLLFNEYLSMISEYVYMLVI